MANEMNNKRVMPPINIFGTVDPMTMLANALMGQNIPVAGGIRGTTNNNQNQLPVGAQSVPQGQGQNQVQNYTTPIGGFELTPNMLGLAAMLGNLGANLSGEGSIGRAVGQSAGNMASNALFSQYLQGLQQSGTAGNFPRPL
jgi:hypothetical protein